MLLRVTWDLKLSFSVPNIIAIICSCLRNCFQNLRHIGAINGSPVLEESYNLIFYTKDV